MNLATGSMTFGRNHRFVFGGLIAALSTAVILTGVAIWQATDSGSTRTALDPSVPASAGVVVPSEPVTRAIAPVHYYLVNSQDQIDSVLMAEFEASNANGGSVTQRMHIIDLRTPEGEALARALQEDLYIASTTPDARFDASLVQVHDLTAGPPIPISKRDTVDGQADASRLPKLYIVGSQAEKDALIREADVAAATEGSEFLVPDVLVVDSPAQQRVYEFIVLEQGQFEQPKLELIDLRE